MATSSHISLSPTHVPIYARPPLASASATTTSKCLQDNHDNHHIFFNTSGFHNHIAHHLLTLYALGSPPGQIQSHYDRTKKIQRPTVPLDDAVLRDIHAGNHTPYLGNEKYYLAWLLFYQDELTRLGTDGVLQEYILNGSPHADDMLVRLHAGFLHPLIHLGFGVEFSQPAIIAEGLAEAAVHDNWLAPFFFAAEKEAATQTPGSGASFVSLLDAIQADSKLATAAHWSDGNKIRDGIMARAPSSMIKYASQWKVPPTPAQIPTKMAEMINAGIYMTGCAQHPPKAVKFDFYFMHCVNCSLFYPALLSLPSLTLAQKCRLLEWKGRLDLCMYASRRAPRLLIDEVTEYKPKKAGIEGEGWDGIIRRVLAYPDDGHAGKLVRALAFGEEVSKPYAGDERFRVKPDMWLKLGHMAIDSVEREEGTGGDTMVTWVRSAGFEEAWEEVEERERAQM